MLNEVKDFKKYLTRIEKAENTIEKYVRDLENMYEHMKRQKEYCRGELASPSINKESILKYKEHLINKYSKTSTINSKLSSINAYLKYIGKDELKTTLIKKQKKYFSDVNATLSKEELNSMLNACKNNTKNKLIIETIARTGIRASELKYITYEAIINNVAVVNNKGKVREVILPRDLCEKIKYYMCDSNNHKGELREPLVSRGELSKGAPLGVTSPKKTCRGELASPIFVTRNKKPIDRKAIWSILKNVARKANIDTKKAHPHNLRHLFAREFYNKTKDIVKLSLILGHSSIETTKIYVRSSLEECRELVERLEIVKYKK